MSDFMSYDDYLCDVKKCIVTDQGNFPVTPLFRMLQGKWNPTLIEAADISAKL